MKLKRWGKADPSPAARDDSRGQVWEDNREARAAGGQSQELFHCDNYHLSMIALPLERIDALGSFLLEIDLFIGLHHDKAFRSRESHLDRFTASTAQKGFQGNIRPEIR